MVLNSHIFALSANIDIQLDSTSANKVDKIDKSNYFIKILYEKSKLAKLREDLVYNLRAEIKDI